MLETVHILCAARDTHHVVRQLCREMDDGEHCLFDFVEDGASVLASCQRAAPDILVLDAVLPGMDGIGVMDCLKEMLHERMPSVIGGSVTPFSAHGFCSRGVRAVVQVPWQKEELAHALMDVLEEKRHAVNWTALADAYDLAAQQLRQMNMREALKGFAYLAWTAALAYENESRLHAVGRELYEPVAKKYHTTQAGVERLIRHAIESTMSAARARGVYSRFGNTIDPAKGKPTNAQVIALLVQRMRIEKNQNT